MRLNVDTNRPTPSEAGIVKHARAQADGLGQLCPTLPRGRELLAQAAEIAGDGALRLAALVGIGAVDQRLHVGGVTPLDVAREALRDDQRHRRSAADDGALCAGHVRQAARQLQRAVRQHTGHGFAAEGRLVVIDDDGGQVVHVQVHGKAEDRELDQRRHHQHADHTAIGQGLPHLLHGHGKELHQQLLKRRAHHITFAAGQATSLDVIDALDRRTAAAVGLETARANLGLALAELRTARGNPW